MKIKVVKTKIFFSSDTVDVYEISGEELIKFKKIIKTGTFKGYYDWVLNKENSVTLTLGSIKDLNEMWKNRKPN